MSMKLVAHAWQIYGHLVLLSFAHDRCGQCYPSELRAACRICCRTLAHRLGRAADVTVRCGKVKACMLVVLKPSLKPVRGSNRWLARRRTSQCPAHGQAC